MTIRPDLQVIKDGKASCSTACEWRVGALGLERTPEARQQGVVIAVTAPAQADGNAMRGEQGQVILAGVLAALVGVVQPVTAWLTLSQCQSQRLFNQLL